MGASPLPWEKYGAQAESAGPWQKYAQPAPNEGLAPPAGSHVQMQEVNILDPNDAGQPSKGPAPAGKLSGLPGVNPHVPTYKEGTNDVMLAGTPLAATASGGQVVRGALAGALGGAVAKSGAEAAGLGKTGQELSETGGQLLGGGLGAAAPEIAASRPARTIGAVAKPVASAAEELPVIGGVMKAGKALGKFKGVPGELSDIWGKGPEYPGAPEPAVPPKEVLQAGSLYRGVHPVEDPAAGLGQIPVKRGQLAESVQQPAPIQRGSLRQMVDQIGNKVGEELKASPPPDPKQPIYQRGSLAQNMEGATDLPEGHTPHQSSAMRSSMYDSSAKEFHARMTSGDTTYVYGDVAPEEAEAFNSAESKGKAYQQMKSGHPLVAKIVNGKRVAVKPVAQ